MSVESVQKKVIRAAQHVRHCPRCYREIQAGAAIEVIGEDAATGRKRWAHVGCKPQAAPGRPEPQDDTPDEAPAAPSPGPVLAPADAQKVARLVGEAIQDASVRIRKEVGQEQTASLARGLEGLELAIARRLEAIEQQRPTPKYLVIQAPDQTITPPQSELFHPKFDRILRLACAGKNIFLPGPSGLGKTHIAAQVARFIPNPDGTTGRRFGLISCTIGMPDSELLGRSIPNVQTGGNVFHASDFLTCYEEGGIFLLDEVDAGDANTLLRINAAIANGRLPVPSRTEKPYAEKHPLFVLIAAANTWGSGADRQYVGRNQLDEATLDRFRAYMIPMDYDPVLEQRLCPHQGIYDLLSGFRAKIRENRMERIVSTRLFAEAYDSIVRTRCQSLAELLESFFGGWTTEEQTLVLGKPFDFAHWSKQGK
jgi:cobaltochelatase CobS